jgi:hypothetical protein
MWDCPNGDANQIAGTLEFCPMCGKEREVPRAVVGATVSNQHALPGELGYIAPEEPKVETPKVAEEVAAPVEEKAPAPVTPTTPPPVVQVAPVVPAAPAPTPVTPAAS